MFIARLLGRPSNNEIDLEIFEREREREREQVLEQLASQQVWELDWQRERSGWIGEKDDETY